MRSLIALISLALLFLLVTAAAMAVADDTKEQAAQPNERCESVAPRFGGIEIKCPLISTGKVQRFLFKANFSGGHDDTAASMKITLDELPYECAEGSKTDLVGEDGEVSLHCKLSINNKVGSKHLLAVTLRWRHAEYTDFEFTNTD